MTPEQEAKLDQALALISSVPERIWGFQARSGTQAGSPINMHIQTDRIFGGVSALYNALVSGELGDDLDEQAVAQAVLAVLNPASIAAAVTSAGIGEAVVDAIRAEFND